MKDIFRTLARKFYIKILLLKRRALLRNRGVLIGRHVKIDLFTTAEGKNRLGERVNIQSTALGYGSYIAEGSTMRHTRIGRYCSIGSGVQAGLGSHPTRGFISTHPAFFSTLEQAGFTFVKQSKFMEMKEIEEGGYVVDIGHDVWIGASTIILDGVRIGNGAIIGSNSTVTRDIPDFAIYAGSPARFIRYRFDESGRNFLSEFCWWNRNPAWIEQHAELFSSEEDFFSKLSKC